MNLVLVASLDVTARALPAAPTFSQLTTFAQSARGSGSGSGVRAAGGHQDADGLSEREAAGTGLGRLRRPSKRPRRRSGRRCRGGCRGSPAARRRSWGQLAAGFSPLDGLSVESAVFLCF